MWQASLLAATVVGLLVGFRYVRPAGVVLTGVAVGLLTGVVEVETAGRALRELAAPLGFLVAAVPTAMVLARIGFFDAVAERIAVGRRLRTTLWVFAALVTTLFNLDASIVLLTPLYLRIAHRHGLDPLATAFIPVLMASFASSALPVSNLTNLIVAERVEVSALDFLVRLGPASFVACLVGWWAYRRWLGSPPPVVLDDTVIQARHAQIDRRALRLGIPAVMVLLVGFTLGDLIGIPAWAVATVVVLGLSVALRHLPWRAVPVDAVVVGAGLGVLAAAASPHLGLDRVIGGTGPLADLRTMFAGVVLADTVNNLPALLITLPYADDSSVWPLLAGVNIGPVLWITGSLAGLLWLDIVRRSGVQVTFGQYAAVGWRVGGPALLAATGVVVMTGAWL